MLELPLRSIPNDVLFDGFEAVLVVADGKGAVCVNI